MLGWPLPKAAYPACSVGKEELRCPGLRRAGKRLRTKRLREKRAGNEEIAWLESSQNLGGGLPIDAANPDNGVVIQK